MGRAYIDLKLPSRPIHRDKETYDELINLYNAVNLLATSYEKPARLNVIAGETVALGDLCNIYVDTGVTKIRKAKATDNTKPVHGFCSTIGGIAAGTSGTITLVGTLVYATSLTPGARYFLSEITAGQYTTTAPSTAGNIVQAVGVAISATELFINPSFQWVQL